MRERALGRDDTELLVVRADQAHGGHADAFVDPQFGSSYTRASARSRGEVRRQVKSTRKRISPRQEATNARTDRWPVGARDAVHDAGADTAVVRNPVVAKLPLLDRAEPFHRPLRPVVQLVGLQPHAVGAEIVEEVAELEILRFGIRDGAAS